MTDEILVNNGKRLMTLDELARTTPGMDKLMVEIGYRAGCLYHSAKAGNWALADYFCRTLTKHLDQSAFVRPKYAESMANFLAEDFTPIRKAIKNESGEAFEAAWSRLVERINHYHDEFGKAYIVWKTPEHPPPDLDLTPRERVSRAVRKASDDDD
jgi:hypothetical protein